MTRIALLTTLLATACSSCHHDPAARGSSRPHDPATSTVPPVARPPALTEHLMTGPHGAIAQAIWSAASGSAVLTSDGFGVRLWSWEGGLHEPLVLPPQRVRDAALTRRHGGFLVAMVDGVRGLTLVHVRDDGTLTQRHSEGPDPAVERVIATSSQVIAALTTEGHVRLYRDAAAPVADVPLPNGQRLRALGASGSQLVGLAQLEDRPGLTIVTLPLAPLLSADPATDPATIQLSWTTGPALAITADPSSIVVSPSGRWLAVLERVPPPAPAGGAPPPKLPRPHAELQDIAVDPQPTLPTVIQPKDIAIIDSKTGAVAHRLALTGGRLLDAGFTSDDMFAQVTDSLAAWTDLTPATVDLEVSKSRGVAGVFAGTLLGDQMVATTTNGLVFVRPELSSYVGYKAAGVQSVNFSNPDAPVITSSGKTLILTPDLRSVTYVTPEPTAFSEVRPIGEGLAVAMSRLDAAGKAGTSIQLVELATGKALDTMDLGNLAQLQVGTTPDGTPWVPSILAATPEVVVLGTPLTDGRATPIALRIDAATRTLTRAVVTMPTDGAATTRQYFTLEPGANRGAFLGATTHTGATCTVQWYGDRELPPGKAAKPSHTQNMACDWNPLLDPDGTVYVRGREVGKGLKGADLITYATYRNGTELHRWTLADPQFAFTRLVSGPTAYVRGSEGIAALDATGNLSLLASLTTWLDPAPYRDSHTPAGADPTAAVVVTPGGLGILDLKLGIVRDRVCGWDFGSSETPLPPSAINDADHFCE